MFFRISDFGAKNSNVQKPSFVSTNRVISIHREMHWCRILNCEKDYLDTGKNQGNYKDYVSNDVNEKI